MAKANRKLATILATDCVDFSKHMEAEEELTLDSLKSCRQLIDPLIEEYGGRIFHTAGDSIIAEFNSPVQCVTAAVEFQKVIAERNKALEVGPKLVWRVGIHVDDVIIEGKDIYGSGVNIAARLEAQCEPGEILLSKIVQDQVLKRTNFSIRSAGTRSLKNISDDFEVFNITPILDDKFLNPKLYRKSNQALYNLNDLKNKPKLAIIPFNNTNKDDDSGYLVDGIVEDLITEFSMIREFDIISRQTSFDFRENNLDTASFAKTHAVDFIVSGGIRSSGTRVRISLELSDASDGSVIWGRKYDRIIDDIFDVQDEIVRTITITLLGQIEISSLQRSKRKPTENISSYESLLRGKEMHHQFNKASNAEALRFFDNALEADSSNAQAHAWKACTIGQGLIRGYIEEDQNEVFAKLKNHIAMALELNEYDFECHRMLSAVHLSTHEYKLAEEHGRKAFNMNPNDPRVLSGYGEVLVRNGSIKKGLELLEKALEIDPIPQGQVNSDNRLKDLLLGHFLGDDFPKCIEISKEIQDIDFKTWIISSFAKLKMDSTVNHIKIKREEFCKFDDHDWSNQIDRLHIPNKDKNQVLIDFMAEVTQDIS
ncbi:MAG: adenylate/guanylate cyclase domain-containing protein [Rhodospirillales bacterium]